MFKLKKSKNKEEAVNFERLTEFNRKSDEDYPATESVDQMWQEIVEIYSVDDVEENYAQISFEILRYIIRNPKYNSHCNYNDIDINFTDSPDEYIKAIDDGEPTDNVSFFVNFDESSSIKSLYFEY